MRSRMAGWGGSRWGCWRRSRGGGRSVLRQLKRPCSRRGEGRRSLGRPSLRRVQLCRCHRTGLTVRDAPHVTPCTSQPAITPTPSAHGAEPWVRLPAPPPTPDAALPAGPAAPRDLPRTGCRGEPNGGWRPLVGRARLPGLSALRHSRSWIRTSTVRRLWLRLSGRVGVLCILHLFRTGCYTDRVSVPAEGSGILIHEAVGVVDAVVA